MRPANITPFFLFKFLHFPFGLREATQTFQRMMDKIFCELPFCFIYLDDILVFSNSLESHQQYHDPVFDLCCLHNLTINLEKCMASTLANQSPAPVLLIFTSQCPPSPPSLSPPKKLSSTEPRYSAFNREHGESMVRAW